MIDLTIAKLTLGFNIQNHIIINLLDKINIFCKGIHEGKLFISKLTLRTSFNMYDLFF